MFLLHPRPTNDTIATTVVSDQWRSILNELSLEEKVSLLTARDFSCTQDIPRVQIPSLKTGDSTSAVKGASLGNPLPTACFPNTSALAASWNRDLLFEMGKAVAQQARYKAAQIVLGPTVNLHRHPRGGRNFEAFSEDPVLTGQLAASLVNGIQTSGVAACAKHFVCNDGDTMRKKYSSEVDERTMRELYLAPFQWVVREANPVLIMSAYNMVNGTYCCETPLYKQVVQKEWGFQGSWMSDWYGTESTAAAIEAGLDIEMPGPSKARGSRLIDAVERGQVRSEVIDERVLGILKMVQRTEEAHSTAKEEIGLDTATNSLIRQIAAESIVLLKNANDTLPLNLQQSPKIAVVGEPALAYCGGGGSASGLPQYYKTPLDAIKAAHPKDGHVVHHPGLKLHRCVPMAPPHILSTQGGRNGVEIVYYANKAGESPRPVHRERKPVPIVFILGHLPDGVDEKEGFTYEMTTTLTPKSSGDHTLAVLATGAFHLYVNDQEVLSQAEPQMSVEDFLFVPHGIEKRCSIPMESGTSYQIRLVTDSRRELNIDEPTPHSSKLCFIEEYSDDAAIASAGKIANDSDISIVFAGRNNEWEQEGSDMEDLFLPKRQAELINCVASNSKKTIVVLLGGNPFDVRDWLDNVEAVVFAHFPGQEGGAAITDILVGKVCPSGRLPMTWPRMLGDVPADKNFPCKMESGKPVNRYEEGLRVGYRHFWSIEQGEPPALFDFGFGLSYTKFSVTDLLISESVESDSEVILTAQVKVRNVGSMAGAEVVQVYVEDIESSVWRPRRELKGFEKVFLQPGEEKTVRVSMLRKYALSFWKQERRQWCAEKGEFRIYVGTLVQDYVLREDFYWRGL